jgi:hypothetical protein
MLSKYPDRESLVSDNRAGDGKIANLFTDCLPGGHLDHAHIEGRPEKYTSAHQLGHLKKVRP